MFDDDEEEEEDEFYHDRLVENAGENKDDGVNNDDDIRLKFPMIHEEEEELVVAEMEERQRRMSSSESASKKKSSSSKSLFFDIGESFADNTKRLWNDPATAAATSSSSISSSNNNNNNNIVNRNVNGNVLSLADSMSEEEGGESTTRSGYSEDRSGSMKGRGRFLQQQPPPLLLPSLRNDSNSSVGMYHLPASRSGGSASSDGGVGFEKLSLWENEMLQQVGRGGEGGWAQQHRRREEAVSADDDGNIFQTTGSFSIIAHSNEGEIVSFHESEKCATRLIKPTTSPHDSSLEQLDTTSHQQRSSPRQVIQQPRNEQNSKETGLNSPPCLRSTKRRSKRRGGGGNNHITTAQSLEEQILSVLQQQPESHVVGSILDDELELVERGSSMKVNTTRVKSGTVGSAASAQDILRELRSSTTTPTTSDTLPIDHSLNYSCNNRSSNKPPLGSISIGMRGLNLGLNGSNKESSESDPHLICSSVEDHLEESNGDVRPPTPSTLALAPSPRDIPRPGRCRRSISDSTPSIHAANTVLSAASPRGCIVTKTMPKENEPRPEAPDALRSAEGTSSESINTMSPLERYCKALGTNTEQASAKNSRLRGRIFPCTTPVTSDAMKGGTPRVPAVPRHSSTNPFDGPSTNPFDSPPRSLSCPKEPFEEQSSPIPVEKSGETYISQDASGSVNKSGTSTSTPSSEMDVIPMSTPSQRGICPPTVLLLKPSKRDTVRSRSSPPPNHQAYRLHNFDDIHVSASQLQINCMERSENASSLPIHDEESVRHIVREIDYDCIGDGDESNIDNGIFEAVKTRRFIPANDVERSIHQQPAAPHNQLREELANATVMDDDVVEDAVQAATEYLSTTSTSSNDLDEDEQMEHVEAGEDEEFFVIPSPQHRIDWSAFDPNVGCSNDFDFRPSESMDEWGDDDRWGFDEDDGLDREDKGKYFASPTSVAAGRHLS